MQSIELLITNTFNRLSITLDWITKCYTDSIVSLVCIQLHPGEASQVRGGSVCCASCKNTEMNLISNPYRHILFCAHKFNIFLLFSFFLNISLN